MSYEAVHGLQRVIQPEAVLVRLRIVGNEAMGLAYDWCGSRLMSKSLDASNGFVRQWMNIKQMVLG